MSGQERTLVDTVVAAPLDTVWRALREPDQIRRWFGWDYDGLDAEVRAIFRGGDVVEDAPASGPRTLTWPDGDRFVLGPAEGAEDATRVQVRRRTPSAVDAVVPAYDAVDEGWITFAHQLRFALERHPGEGRRTVWADGLDLGPYDEPLLTRLGLRPFGDDPVGSSYTVTREDGTSFGGEIFFQTDLQLGLTVREERDGLLVVARRPPAVAPPNGQVMFVLSTYGLDPTQLDELESRWRQWWSPSQEHPGQPPELIPHQRPGRS